MGSERRREMKSTRRVDCQVDSTKYFKRTIEKKSQNNFSSLYRFSDPDAVPVHKSFSQEYKSTV